MATGAKHTSIIEEKAKNFTLKPDNQTTDKPLIRIRLAVPRSGCL